MRPLLLDISRLISRVGRGPLSGIDRVELAYFKRFLAQDAPVHFLCRLPRGYAVLNRDAGQEIYNKIMGLTPWPSSRVAGLLLPGTPPETRAALVAVWRRASEKCQERHLAHCLKEVFHEPIRYFNVGHSNLRQTVFSAVHSLNGSEIIVLIHDIIPILYPEFTRTKITARFHDDMRRVAASADRVIYNSTQTRQDAEALFRDFGSVPNGIECHLGVDDAVSAPETFPDPSKTANFVILGTIEPRKNHALLLSIWSKLSQMLPSGQVPRLHLIGRRGWGNENVFSILDSDCKVMKHVSEHNVFSDSQARSCLQQSWGLLFPSFAEGFGLPLVEAARLGLPIICGDSHVYHEILGDYPVYLNVDNSYLWEKEILERAGRHRESGADRQKRAQSVMLPDWDAHFDRIFRFICEPCGQSGFFDVEEGGRS